MNADERAMFVRVISGGIKTALEPLKERIKVLESQQAEFKYCGVWTSGREYKAGNFCTHSGGIWHCDEPSTETPGKSNAWTLAVKSGR